MKTRPTLAHIHGNCIADGDCLVWTGHTNGSGIPKVNNHSGRRLVWELVNGRVPARQLVGNSCGCLGCLNPAHLVLKSRRKVSLDAITPAMRQRRKVSNALVARAQATKLTLDIARAIRRSNEPQQVLAERYGVHRSRISQIQRGLAWPELDNPFAGLVR